MLITILTVLGALVIIIWGGLQINPRPFPSLPASQQLGSSIAVPDSLPAPVKSFYTALYVSNVPVITSAVIAGRAKMRINGITFPARFQFFHEAGKSYRHRIELTFWGFPVMKVNEYYNDGNATLKLPFGTIENEPKVDQGANLALWGEAIWFPSIFLSDQRMQWKSVDDETAILCVPFGEKQQQIVVRFDPDSGMPRYLEAMRYKQAEDTQKTLWIIETTNWTTVNNHTVCSTAAITWFDEEGPWTVFQVEDITYNTNIKRYLQQGES